MSIELEWEPGEKKVAVALAVAVAILLALVIGYYVWRDRPSAARVRLTSALAETAGCDFVTDLSTTVGTAAGSRPRMAQGEGADVAAAEASLRMAAAAAGADTVVVTEQGPIVHAKAYRCRREEAGQ